jgi:hypothetical protein
MPDRNPTPLMITRREWLPEVFGLSLIFIKIFSNEVDFDTEHDVSLHYADLDSAAK